MSEGIKDPEQTRSPKSKPRSPRPKPKSAHRVQEVNEVSSNEDQSTNVFATTFHYT